METDDMPPTVPPGFDINQAARDLRNAWRMHEAEIAWFGHASVEGMDHVRTFIRKRGFLSRRHLPTCVRNVLSGKSALGGVSRMPPLPVPRDTGFAADVTRHAHHMIDVIRHVHGASPTQSEERLTAFVWKLATFLLKTGNAIQNRRRADDLVFAASYLANHPDAVTSRAGMAKFAQLGREANSAALHEFRRAPGEYSQRRNIAALRKAHDAQDAWASRPPPDACWTSSSGRYGLFELTHPLHVFEEGLALRNCLATVFSGAAATRKLAYPRDLHNLTYWRSICSGLSRLFSFRFEDIPFACLELAETHLYDLSLSSHMSPDDLMVLVRSLASLTSAEAPLHLPHTSDRVMTLVPFLKILARAPGGAPWEMGYPFWVPQT